MASLWWSCRSWGRWIRRRKFEWWAKLLTAGYLSLFLGIVTARFVELKSLPLNELGDFAAGAFGPLAFLWLVLGYRQQGVELRISSEALIEQAKELKLSVEQQRLNIERQDRLADPFLHLKYIGSEKGVLGSKDFFELTNLGEPCTEVAVHLISESEGVDSFYIYLGPLVAGVTREFPLCEMVKVGGDIMIRFRRRTGTVSWIGFSYRRPESEEPFVLRLLDEYRLGLVIDDMRKRVPHLLIK
ncbi:hypothetical protein HWD96_10130 [Pseudomonas putida]|uniref:hypothetical protein n=1 Tax=Pseudomonas putida TaxID=303 RepID=UPI001F519073|nr:hypothetical protein [Pseudomonas putida]MCI1022591.1 hypothetical protein [Pseudomonas putida]